MANWMGHKTLDELQRAKPAPALLRALMTINRTDAHGIPRHPVHTTVLEFGSGKVSIPPAPGISATFECSRCNLHRFRPADELTPAELEQFLAEHEHAGAQPGCWRVSFVDGELFVSCHNGKHADCYAVSIVQSFKGDRRRQVVSVCGCPCHVGLE